MLDCPLDVVGIQCDGLEAQRVVARVDAPGFPKLRRIAPAQLWRLVDMAVQRQRRRMLLDERPQRLAADVSPMWHLIQRRVSWRRVADIDRALRVALARQGRQRLRNTRLRCDYLRCGRLYVAAPTRIGHVKAEWRQRPIV